jgi:hypothetical protein
MPTKILESNIPMTSILLTKTNAELSQGQATQQDVRRFLMDS